MALTTPTTININAPQFTDQVVGALSPVALSTQIAYLVELRCLSNMLNPGADLNVMRAEELQTITSPLGAM
jgi:hypothetical protein